MKTLIKIFVVLILFTFSQNIYSQSASTQGKEFYVSFMRNYEYKVGQADVSLTISAKRACSGTIENVLTGWSIPFSVGNNDLIKIQIPASEAYSITSEIIERKGLRVTSTDTISLFASNYQNRSFDITGVLPLDALMDEYIIQSYKYDRTQTKYKSPFSGSEFLIVGTEDKTIIDITPTATTKLGHLANSTFQVMLSRGETYQVRALDSLDDFSGTKVCARDCKKIAVFNGNDMTQVPSGYVAGDHIVEQSFPTAYWGTKFAITGSARRNSDRIRITALKNGTNIKKNGFNQMSINAGQTYEFELSNAEGSCYVETSQPCAVYLYMVGVEYGVIPPETYIEEGTAMGDPSMLWISPIEQKIEEITFATYQTSQIRTHYVNIVTETSSVATMTLDGINISSQFKPLKGNADFSYAQVSINHGTHTLSNTSGFNAHVYGMGHRESYAYSVGSATRDLQRAIFINDIRYSPEIFATQSVCVNNSVKFHAMLNYAYESIRWNFGDGNSAVGDTVYNSYANDGNYSIEMIVKREKISCMGDLYDTVRADIFTVKGFPRTEIYDTICDNQRYQKYNFDLSPKSDTTITETIKTTGCDSTVILHLKINPTYNNAITDAICLGDTYNKNGFNVTPTETGIFSFTKNDKTKNGCNCDSVTNLTLTVNPIYNIKLNETICEGETYHFNNHTYSAPGVYADTLRKTLKTGCDSIVYLNLTINKSYHKIINDTICDNNTYNLNGTIYSKTGTYNQKDTTVCGCDSIVTLNLLVNPTYTNNFVTTICEGDSCIFNRTIYKNVGIYNLTADTLSVCNCDSTTNLNLTINPSYNNYVSATIYEDENYKIGDSVMNTSGLHAVKMRTVDDCDSIVNLNLNVIKYPNEITAFSPFNKDGINDYFMPGLKIQVFNRWGTLIYETITEEQKFLGWDGTNTRGVNVEPGVYFYILYRNSGKPLFKSSVEVLKK